MNSLPSREKLLKKSQQEGERKSSREVPWVNTKNNNIVQNTPLVFPKIAAY
jgi:hypothetical protein